MGPRDLEARHDKVPLNIALLLLALNKECVLITWCVRQLGVEFQAFAQQLRALFNLILFLKNSRYYYTHTQSSTGISQCQGPILAH